MSKITTYCILILSLCYFSVAGQNSLTDIDVSDVVVQQHLYPNPVFQGNNCKLDLLLKYESSISVAVFDIIGNKVVEIDEYYHKGNHNLLLQTNNLEKGVYFVNIVAGYEKYVKRLIIR